MIGEVLNHLWQSTAFSGVVALLALTVRGAPAHVRYWLWLAASVKFLVPLTLLIEIGVRLSWGQSALFDAKPRILLVFEQVSWPFSDPRAAAVPSTGAADWLGLAVLGLWALGSVLVAFARLRSWRRIRVVVDGSVPSQIRGANVPTNVLVRSSPSRLEPSVVGWLRPTLLVPAGIDHYLTPQELDAVIRHEICHVRRRDNLTAAIHMVVEAVFWFYPLVWWIGARLVDERERACDEGVLRSGSSPRVYAEAIFKTCQYCVRAPLACVAGVTGSRLGKRIEMIMMNSPEKPVDIWKHLALCATIGLAVAIPVAVGVLGPRQVEAHPAGGSRDSSAEVAAAGVQGVDENFCCPSYPADVIARVDGNWARHSDVAASNTMRFTVERGGRIVNVEVESSSGLQKLDELSRQALLATGSVPPLPSEFAKPTLTIHLRFPYGADQAR